jgi:hypothetical protein
MPADSNGLNVEESIRRKYTVEVRYLLSKQQATRNEQLTMDFDETRLYYSHQQLQRPNAQQQQQEEDADDANDEENDESVDLKAVRRHFREFLRE